MIEWLPWLPSKSCYTNLKFFETLKDTPNPSKGFRFVAFLVLEILGGSFSTPPPPLVLGVGTKTLGARRVKSKYGDRAKLLFTDTDSLTYEIEAEDVYKDFGNDKYMFDNSDYPGNSPYYCRRPSENSKTKLVAFRLSNLRDCEVKCIAT